MELGDHACSPDAETKRPLGHAFTLGALGWGGRVNDARRLALVQKCKSACGLCKGANVGIHFRVPGLGPQVSGAGYQVQVRVRENSGPEPVPEPEDLNLAPDG
jgi:hypothetical protein